MLFKKRAAPTFNQPSENSQPQRPLPNQAQPQFPQQPGGKDQHQQPRQSQSLTAEQLTELQQFMQMSFQSVTEYEFLHEQMPTEHLASTIRSIIEDEKKHYQTMLHFYKTHTGKDPSIAEALLNRNAYIPALKKAFEQEQMGASLFEEAARYTPSSRLRDIYTSLARDQQRHAIWILSYLTIYSNQTNDQKS